MRHYIYTFLFLLVSQAALSQTPATIVKDGSYTVDSSSGTVALTATQSITLKPDTWIKSGSTFLAQIVEPTTALDDYTPFSFSNENYVFTRSFQAPMATFNAATAKEGDVVESITYFDGLGRPMQSIGIKTAPDKKDIITHIDYDAYGRQDKDWLPYHETSGTSGTYRGDRATATKQYYMDNYADDFTGVALPDINAYSQKGLEASPLNRILEQGAPGADWVVNKASDTDRTIKFEYQANTASEVKQYGVTLAFANNTYTPTLAIKASNNGFYEANELYKTITKDENWTSGTSHTTEEFKDKQGRVILKRTYGTSVVNGVSQTNVAHDTYYVYDDYGNLTYVLPPKMDASTASLTTVNSQLDDLGYQYRYDHRNRLVEKKIPGKDWEYIVYNNLDQPVLTQDALQRPNKQWLFTKYDAFGRVVYTGIYTHGSVATRLQMVTALNTYYSTNTSEDLFEEKLASEGSYHYYSNGTFPNTGLEVLTVNYYDDYSFNRDGLSLPATADGQAVINHDDANKLLTKGLATGSKVKVLTTNDWITSLTGYDAKGRPIYAASNNGYLSTTDIVASKLDFVGKVEKVTATHTKTGQATITTQDDFVYDHEGRLLRQKQAINGLGQETLVDNTYDKLGQLETKGVGGKSSSANRLQDVDYAYNVRGWLKQINNPTTLGNDLFSFKLNYNTNNHGGTNLFNGNIAETEWKTANTDNSLHWYKYDYDALNRLTNAVDNLDKLNETLNYDKNGNITHLVRLGHIVGGNTIPDITNPNHFGVMDDLTYIYSGNKLQMVSDNGDDFYGFKDLLNITTEFAYDANGNMKHDFNKGIVEISYNHLNLPVYISLNGGSSVNTGTISYIYDATGVKLKKTVSTGVTTEYAGNYVYENGSLKFFSHPEGYVEPDGNGGFNYVYQYKDHLGNVRLSYMDSDGNGSITASTEILEENNYYPFGLKHKGYNTNVASTNIALKRKFGGKEFQDELDLNWYDVTARNYDPAIGRWMNLDPLAEQMRRHSPYNYAFNNPVFFIDYDGMAPTDPIDPDEKTFVNTTSATVVGENVVNQLDEVVIGTVTSSSSKGAHVEGNRFNGFKIEGETRTQDTKTNGSVSGFSAGYENTTEGNMWSGNASVYGAEAEFSSKQDGVTETKGKVSVFKAETSGAFGVYSPEVSEGKEGVAIKGSIGLYAAKGEVSTSVTIPESIPLIGGFKIGMTRGASFGSAHIGGGVEASTVDGVGTLRASANIGLGVGAKYGFSFSTAKLKP